MSESESTLFSLQGAVAVVTGATRGIGRATAEVLGRAGADVVVVGRSTRENPSELAPGTLDDVVEELAADGIQSLGVQADLTVPEQVDEVVAKTLEWRGRCDVLVNNVAYTSNRPILDVPARRWHLGFQAQVVTPLQLCQGFVPGMLERERGRVLNVGTRAASVLLPNLGLYGITKLAGERTIEFLDFEWSGRGVSFNTFRIDKIIPTDAYRLSLERQGEGIAKGGLTEDDMVSAQECGEIIEWMLTRPSSWSGKAIEIQEARDLQAAGGEA
jgi:NAD(P)-dependent dehydrogenase (short-subunit alcohol dehydrogenase family)